MSKPKTVEPTARDVTTELTDSEWSKILIKWVKFLSQQIEISKKDKQNIPDESKTIH